MKQIFWLITLIFIGLNGFSQTRLSPKIGFRTGIVAGAPIPTQIDSGATGKPIPSYSLGLTVQVLKIGHFALTADVLYERKFSTYTSHIPRTDTTLVQNVLGFPTQISTYFTGDVKGRMNLHYLTIPIQANYYPTRRLKVMAGGYIAPLFAGQDTGLAHLVIGNNFTTSDNHYDNFPSMRKMDIGVSAGIGYDFPFGLYVDLRMQRALKTLLPDQFFYDNNQKVSKMYNTSANLGVGYYFFRKRGLI